MTAVLELRDLARAELNEIFFARAERRDDEERSDQDSPEVEPAMSPSIPGRTYENPNEDETYTSPEEDPKAVTDYEDDYEDDEDEDDDEDLEDDEDDEL